jgi:hypothetical protein
VHGCTWPWPFTCLESRRKMVMPVQSYQDEPISYQPTHRARRAAKGSKPGCGQVAVRIVRSVSLWLVLIGLALALAASYIIVVLCGSDYLGSTPALLVLVSGIWALGIGKLLATHMAGSGRPGVGTNSAAISLVFTVIPDLTLIPEMAIVVVAVVLSVSYSISLVVIVAFVPRRTGFGAADLLIPQPTTCADWRSALLRCFRFRVLDEATPMLSNVRCNTAKRVSELRFLTLRLASSRQSQ